MTDLTDTDRDAANRVHYTDPRVRQLASAAWQLATGGTHTDWLRLGKDHPATLIFEARGWIRAAVAAGLLPAPTTPDGYGALFAGAREEPPFASGTDQAAWIAANCGTCVHDREQRPGGPAGPGCPLVVVALMGRTPAQWVRAGDGDHRCIEYRRDGDVPAGDAS